MDTRIGMVSFLILVVLFAFSFVFCLEALTIPNTLYGILAVIGFVFCVAISLFEGMVQQREGGALGALNFTFTVITSIIFIWYLTRCGTAFGWW
jgi:hypothetical protein